jgi:serine protease Do
MGAGGGASGARQFRRALADAQGRVVGLNAMVVSGGLALAVPSDAVAVFLRRGGPRVLLGVTVRPVRLDDRRSIGLVVLEVTPGGAASSSSILIGDVLLGANGRAFASVDDLGEAVEAAADAVLTLQFLRGDRHTRREVAVRLIQRGAEAA